LNFETGCVTSTQLTIDVYNHFTYYICHE